MPPSLNDYVRTARTAIFAALLSADRWEGMAEGLLATRDAHVKPSAQSRLEDRARERKDAAKQMRAHFAAFPGPRDRDRYDAFGAGMRSTFKDVSEHRLAERWYAYTGLAVPKPIPGDRPAS